MPSTHTAVTSAASTGLRPKRAATRSAMDVALTSRATRTRRCSTPMPSAYSRIEPTKVGGSHQPDCAACVTVP